VPQPRKKTTPTHDALQAVPGPPPETPDEPEQPPINAVVVHRIHADDGSIQCVAEPIGNVVATEVATILKLGLREFEKRIGV